MRLRTEVDFIVELECIRADSIIAFIGETSYLRRGEFLLGNMVIQEFIFNGWVVPEVVLVKDLALP